MKVGIVGLGLIGGSLGLDLKKTKIVSKIVGYDNNIAHCEEALKLKLVDEIVPFEDLKNCDIVFLAIPVEAIIETLQKLKDAPKNCTIVDLGSTKEKIVKSVPKEIREQFIAAHPMAGTENFGPSAALEGLYKGNIVVLCDLEENSDLHKNRAILIFSHIGMKIIFMDSKNHDRHVAFISHMPHAVSYALANSVMKQEDPQNILLLAVGGFKGMSRIAKSSPKMWSDIFKQNKNNLLKALRCFKDEIDKVENLVESENWEDLEKWMQEGREIHKIL
ncbi:MAG: prephenate dehydrogenase [Epsilonproteobacteria bacterium]|nr:prephenate dehydrogenase [Campylobacterota bacterium]